MRKLPLLLGVGLLATSVTIGAIGCSSDNDNGNASDTPTSVVVETPTVSATTPETTGTPAGTAEAGTPTVEATTTPAATQ